MIVAIAGTAAVTAVTVTTAHALLSRWRECRDVIRQTRAELDRAVPYWPAGQIRVLAAHEELLNALCGPCHDRDDCAPCICSSDCGHPECMGGFSNEDLELLHGPAAAEGDDQ